MFKSKGNYMKILDALHLPKIERMIINQRFVNEVRSAERQYAFTAATYYILTNVITVGTVLVTAFHSIQKISLVPETAADVFFWLALAISIIVILANKLLNSFNLQKNFVLDKLALEKYRTEGWQYISGIGRYEKGSPTDNFKLFAGRIEKLKMKITENAVSGESGKDLMSQNSAQDLHMYTGAPMYIDPTPQDQSETNIDQQLDEATDDLEAQLPSQEVKQNTPDTPLEPPQQQSN